MTVPFIGIPTAPHTKPKTDVERRVYFWTIGGAQCGSHVTPCTPNWCAAHKTAFDTHCPPCAAAAGFAARRNGTKGATAMLEPQTTEREIEVELTEEECEERRVRFEGAWEEEQQINSEKLAELSGFNKRLRDVRGLQKALHTAFSTGKEKRKVEVFERRNERLHQVETVEKATGKIMAERAMTADERQEKMFSEDGKQAKVKAKSNGKAPELSKEPLKAKVGDIAAAKAKNKKGNGKPVKHSAASRAAERQGVKALKEAGFIDEDGNQTELGKSLERKPGRKPKGSSSPDDYGPPLGGA